ncbi:TetR/AcrR family transcriptional regulator [Franconibacter helveticus]|uniref:TetR/AcrR family transcriptional regulator n=1 Tax=Franconibacter helveticus TaxID=357240 RepID=UPI00066DC7F3|nr:TetR/AcrR family transcriptional regulator [Franconibacter helveticus]MDU6924541.1 TetR/AcrR family transcriptional regulator [Franconibacter helveticus]
MPEPRARQRLSREERYEQLTEMAWRIIRQEGTEALTLGHLAACAGVTKPVVYDHFTSRAGLLAALYRDYDQRQTAKMNEALRNAEPKLETLASVIAEAYVACVLHQGREMPSVMAALNGTPELEKLRQEYAVSFIRQCRDIFAPFCGDKPLADAPLWAMFGAAETLSWAAAKEMITEQQARDELLEAIIAMVQRQAR